MLVVASEDHRFLISNEIAASGGCGTVILEPEPRNTAAAMSLAAIAVSETSPDELLLFCPADHHIPDAHLFRESVLQGVPAAQAGAIVTFGVAPTFPSTAYGYIQLGEKRTDGSHQVRRFIEKPGIAEAQEMLLAGGTQWNAGIFLCRASTLLAGLKRYNPDILASCQEAMRGSTREPASSDICFLRPEATAFEQCRSQSIDYALIQVHDNVSTVPFFGQWSDIGSWNAVAALTAPDEKDNRVVGRGLTYKSNNTYIHAPHRPVVSLGTSNLFIVDTPDAVLISDGNFTEEVRDVVALLGDLDAAEALTHRKVARPWGWYDCIDSGPGFQVKRLGIRPGGALSLQYHLRRAEHWVVVSGTAEVTRGREVFILKTNESTYIPVGEVHRLRNIGSTELQLIEVQSGEYLGEDDIVRIDDAYGRTTQ